MRLFGTFLKRVVGAIALEVSAYKYMRQMIREQEQGSGQYLRDAYSETDAKSIVNVCSRQETQAPATH